MIALLSIMSGARLWEQEGIDVRDFEFTDDPLGAEELLVGGEIDFIFGNHVSPYMRLAHGYPLVCLAQTENWEHIWFATAPDITSLSMLQGKRVVSPPLIIENDEFAGHAFGSRLLALELQGIDTGKLQYVRPEAVNSPIDAIREGKADVCAISPERAERATKAGLRVHELPPMGMVHSITFTTTMPRILKQPELAERVIRTLARSIYYFRTRREETLALLDNPVMPFAPGRLERLAEEYDEQAAAYEASLYPRAEAILNVHRLSSMAYEESRKVNPMELWNVHPLRQVHLSGFFEQLYGERAPAGAAG
jgi:ABC-type nitrate/sulfonate/bicarbonate transport system substrate-binding protein